MNVNPADVLRLVRQGQADIGGAPLATVSGDVPFLILEYLIGADLKQYATAKPMSLFELRQVVLESCAGLQALHSAGLVHRDIKPANIRVAEDGRAKIMDFGVAHLASSSMTRTGSFLGTPGYMAPEQITEGSTTPATDIFAVGGVLYQLLTQMKPFEGSTLQNLFFKIISEKPRRVSELMPGLPPALDRIVEKAMAKDPAERYANALDMANDLSAVRAKLSGPSYPESVSLSASVSSAIAQAKEARTRSRNFLFAGAGAVTVAAIVIVVILSQLLKSPSSSPTITQQGTPAGDVTAAPPSPLTSPVTARSTHKVPAPKLAPPPPRTAAKQGQSLAVVTPPVTQAALQNAQTQQPAVTTQAPAITPQKPPPSPPQEAAPAPAAPGPPTAADIAPTVEAYARAIESRDIAAIRRVYPGLTSDQQRGFEQFFQSARNINVTFRVANVDGAVSSAEARLVGTYEYVSSAGRTERQPVSFAATLRHDSSGWRLISVR